MPLPRVVEACDMPLPWLEVNLGICRSFEDSTPSYIVTLHYDVKFQGFLGWDGGEDPE